MRVKCIVSYDGTDYNGFQIQNEEKTIELEISKALNKITSEKNKIYPSGRTDRYVHAVGQVFHFDTEKNITAYGFKRALNSYLPNDIRIIDVEIVDINFHSRFSALRKEYRYYISTSPNVFRRNYMHFVPNLNLELLSSASKLLIGTHNFEGFCSAKVDKRKDFVKTIYEININKFDDYIEIIFIGSSFLKYQIRRMMGLLIEISLQKELETKILDVLESHDPKISHKIAPGCGLYLYKVYYE